MEVNAKWHLKADDDCCWNLFLSIYSSNVEGRTQPLLGLMGWKGSSGWGSPACVEQYRSSFWYHSAEALRCCRLHASCGQWVTSWHTLNEMRSGLQVFRVQSATSCLQGYQPTITPNSRALGGVEGPPGAQTTHRARANIAADLTDNIARRALSDDEMGAEPKQL